MTDPQLQNLIASSAAETPDPLNVPAPSVLKYLASLDLSDEDIEVLLGDAPGLSWADMKEDVQSFFFRLRRRIARLVCDDQELKDSVNQSLTVGAEAAWLALVGALGITPSTLAAAALKPIAVGLVTSGVNKLCGEAP
jgi:hypothetical protein